MLDTIIKGTGNSRFLRSSIPENITFSEFVSLLREGALPIDLAGLNDEGIEVKGTALSKGTLLSDRTETALWGTAADRTVDEALAALIPWQLIATIDNTVGYSGEWTAPDVFGDGQPYHLGVYLIGGGESGNAAAAKVALSYGQTTDVTAYGGASGYGKNGILPSISPGDKFEWEIGAGGESRTAPGNNSNTRNPGKYTKFASLIAEGGGAKNATQGGQSAITYISSIARNYYGCVAPDTSSSSHVNNTYQYAREGQNQFDSKMVSLACGMNGRCYASRNESSGIYGKSEQPMSTLMPNPTIGVLGAAACIVDTTGSEITAIGTSGTYGNGGGGAVALQAASSTAVATAVSGSGGDGVIFLYASRKRAKKITVHTVDETGNPLKGVLVSGFSDGTKMSDDTGTIECQQFDTAFNLSVSGYYDLIDMSERYVLDGTDTQEITITVTRRNFISVTSTETKMFSPNCLRVDATLLGGGGKGGKAASYSYSRGASGGGGGGGQVITQDEIAFEANTAYTATVGAQAGATSFLGLTADGGTNGGDAVANASTLTAGAAGVGGGNGGAGVSYGSAGNAGSEGPVGYTSFTESGKLGGGGGSGSALAYGGTQAAGAVGGAPGGGAGGYKVGTSASNYAMGSTGSNATAPGGGGGGGAFVSLNNVNYHYGAAGGTGMPGLVNIRMWFKEDLTV